MKNLVSFETSNTLRQEIELVDGWNWISLNLEAQDESPMGEVMIPTIMNSVNSSSIEVLKGIDGFSQYADNFGVAVDIDNDYIDDLTNPKCIGSIVDTQNDKIYWFITSTNVDTIAEYDETKDIISPL